MQEKSPLGLKKTKQSPKQQGKLFVVSWSANCNHVTVKILTPAEWTLTAFWFVFNIMFLWPCYLCHRMNIKNVKIPSSLMWWVFRVHEVNTAKKSARRQLGMGQKEIRANIDRWPYNFWSQIKYTTLNCYLLSSSKKSVFRGKVTLRCYKCDHVTTSLYASLILLKLPLN